MTIIIKRKQNRNNYKNENQIIAFSRLWNHKNFYSPPVIDSIATIVISQQSFVGIVYVNYDFESISYTNWNYASQMLVKRLLARAPPPRVICPLPQYLYLSLTWCYSRQSISSRFPWSAPPSHRSLEPPILSKFPRHIPRATALNALTMPVCWNKANAIRIKFCQKLWFISWISNFSGKLFRWFTHNQRLIIVNCQSKPINNARDEHELKEIIMQRPHHFVESTRAYAHMQLIKLGLCIISTSIGMVQMSISNQLRTRRQNISFAVWCFM